MIGSVFLTLSPRLSVYSECRVLSEFQRIIPPKTRLEGVCGTELHNLHNDFIGGLIAGPRLVDQTKNRRRRRMYPTVVAQR